MRDKPPRVVPLTRRFRTKVHCQDLATIFSLNVFTLATIVSTAPLLAFLTGCLLLTVRSNNCNYHVVNSVVINSHRSPLFNSVVNSGRWEDSSGIPLPASLLVVRMSRSVSPIRRDARASLPCATQRYEEIRVFSSISWVSEANSHQPCEPTSQ